MPRLPQRLPRARVGPGAQPCAQPASCRPLGRVRGAGVCPSVRTLGTEVLTRSSPRPPRSKRKDSEPRTKCLLNNADLAPHHPKDPVEMRRINFQTPGRPRLPLRGQRPPERVPPPAARLWPAQPWPLQLDSSVPTVCRAGAGRLQAGEAFESCWPLLAPLGA